MGDYVQNIILNKVNERINNIEIDKKKGEANISYMRNTIKNFMNYLSKPDEMKKTEKQLKSDREPALMKSYDTGTAKAHNNKQQSNQMKLDIPVD